MNVVENHLTRCSACNNTFTYRYPTTVTSDNILIRTTCPFCKVPLKIDLSVYQRSKVVTYRGDTVNTEAPAIILDLPNELPAIFAE